MLWHTNLVLWTFIVGPTVLVIETEIHFVWRPFCFLPLRRNCTVFEMATIQNLILDNVTKRMRPSPHLYHQLTHESTLDHRLIMVYIYSLFLCLFIAVALLFQLINLWFPSISLCLFKKGVEIACLKGNCNDFELPDRHLEHIRLLYDSKILRELHFSVKRYKRICGDRGRCHKPCHDNMFRGPEEIISQRSMNDTILAFREPLRWEFRHC